MSFVPSKWGLRATSARLTKIHTQTLYVKTLYATGSPTPPRYLHVNLVMPTTTNVMHSAQCTRQIRGCLLRSSRLRDSRSTHASLYRHRACKPAERSWPAQVVRYIHKQSTSCAGAIARMITLRPERKHPSVAAGQPAVRLGGPAAGPHTA